MFCMVLIISMPFVYADLLASAVPNSNQNPYSTPAGSFSGVGSDLGGFVYRDPAGDSARKYGSGYGYVNDVYLGESIIVQIADYQPKQVRESLLEQSNVPVFFYLKGTTIGTALSPFTDDPSARDPLSGITKIPKIRDIQVRVNSNSADGLNYISGVPNYFPPRPDRYSLNNLGAIVVYLNRIDDESKLPKDNNIVLDMNAKIFFDLEDTSPFGVSQQSLTVKQHINEREFFDNAVDRDSQSFFSGHGYIRASYVDKDSITLQLYNKQFSALSLYSPNSPTSGTGVGSVSSFRLSPTEPIKLVRIDSTGDPLRDVIQVRLDSIVVPADNAEFEIQNNGIINKRKVNIGQPIFSGSKWFVEKVEINTLDNAILTKEDIRSSSFRKDFGVDETSLSMLDSLIDGDIGIFMKELSVTLYNPGVGRSVIKRKVILTKDGTIPSYVKSPKEGAVKFLENLYCGIEDSEKPYKSNNDIACKAVANYKTLIDNYPSASQTKDALKSLAELYEKQLIEYPECLVEPDGNKCNSFRFDMRRLSLYYYERAGISDSIIDRLMGVGGESYLEGEGVGIKLLNAHKVTKEDMGEFDLSITSSEKIIYEKSSLKVGSILHGIGGEPLIIKAQQSGRGGVAVSGITGANQLQRDYYWVVDKINPSAVTLQLYSVKVVDNKKEPDKPQSRTISIPLNTPSNIVTSFAKINPTTGIKDGEDEIMSIEITRIDTKLEAQITVIPGAGRGFVDSNFKINIPIDPRPFRWTPEQLKSQIEKSKTAIETLNTMIDKLDSIVKTWKEVCLGTFAFLTLKNTIGQGASRNIARRQVTSFFRDRCESEVSKGINGFDTVDECLSEYGDEITKATDDTQGVLDDVNSDLTGDIDKINVDDTKCKSFSDYVSAGRSMGLTDNEIRENYGDCLTGSRLLSSYGETTPYGKYITANAKVIDIENSIADSHKADDMLKVIGIGDKNPKRAELKAQAVSSIQRAREAAAKSDNENVLDNLVVTKSDKNNPLSLTAVSFVDIKTSTGISTAALNLVPISVYEYRKAIDDGEDKLLKERCTALGLKYSDGSCGSYSKANLLKEAKATPAVDPALGSIYIAEEFRNSDGNIIKSIPNSNKESCDKLHGELSGTDCKFSSEKSFLRSAIQVDSGGRSTSSTYSGNDLEAMYDNEGLVYCYPTDKGNYVRVMNRYPTGAKAIQDIRLYNVGPNGRIECGGGDDVLLKNEGEFNLPDNLKSKNELVRLGESLGRCVADGDKVGANKLFGKVIRCNTRFAESLLNDIQPKCIDVMDPSDCKLLFNACDPVMCPSSRCTLGGRVAPRNVIQSGIIGSTILCFPNINQGVVVPICLTGVDAGLKNIRSLVEAYNDCLEIKLERNEDVGFCDYIRSVGVCEVMWREAASLVNIGGGLIDYASGKLFSEPEGGQEYLKFQSAFKNVGDTVNFFTKEYKDTYTAQFLGQSSEEIGSQICRLSVNGKYPNVGDIIDQLTEPENPPQFTAFFDEAPSAGPGEIAPAGATDSSYIPMGTNELSLYKVFYHIYAGTGYYSGVYSQPQSLLGSGTPSQIQQPILYSVYLVNPQLGLSPLYVTFRDDETFGGFQGNVESGKYVQKSVQKVGPAGYNQICVNINGQISCGFGKVGSAFGLQELQDIITTDEAETGDIDSAEKCVSTLSNSPSASIARLAAVGGASALGGVDASIGSSGLSIGEGTSPLVGLSTSGIDRSILSNGIVRVCAISSPTPEINRWTIVGSCGVDDKGKDLGDCWLDINSADINDKRLKQGLLNSLKNRGELSDSGLEIIDPEVSRAALISLNEQSKNLIENIVDLISSAKKGDVITEVAESAPASRSLASSTSTGSESVSTAPPETPSTATSSDTKKRGIEDDVGPLSLPAGQNFGVYENPNNDKLVKTIISTGRYNTFRKLEVDRDNTWYEIEYEREKKGWALVTF